MRNLINIVNESFVPEDNLSDDRLATLKLDIEQGNLPTIYNASWVNDPSIWTMGDLENLGWMDKSYTHDSSGEVDGWTRHYTGPQPIMVKTKGSEKLEQLNPGETLE